MQEPRGRHSLAIVDPPILHFKLNMAVSKEGATLFDKCLLFKKFKD
uniref:Uncharacterized protein n=1 Tax=Rhizophora mucronata TaxID=61149 RepID=A0A2P2PDX0_RHIMU